MKLRNDLDTGTKLTEAIDIALRKLMNKHGISRTDARKLLAECLVRNVVLAEIDDMSCCLLGKEEEEDDMLDKLESVPYITIYKNKGCGDEEVQEYKTKEDAIKALKREWSYLSDYDKKHTEFFYVLECADPDPESVHHFDGNIILHVFGVYVGLDSDKQIRFFSSINDEELEFDEDTDVADVLRSASVIREAANSLNITPEQRKYMLDNEWLLKEQLKECENYLTKKHTGANIDNDMLRNRSKNL